MEKSLVGKLSVCLIIKNEEKNLPDCLESIKNIADEIIVCDTGSDDNSIAIAEKFGSKIVHFKWNGSFADARNYSIAAASSNWILWIDADERLPQASVLEIKKIISNKGSVATAFRVSIHNFKKQGEYFYLSTAHRLFPNHFNISFSGMIHEQISPSVSQLNGKEIMTTIIIEHFGYDLSPVQMQKKYKRNLEILLNNLAKGPESSYLIYNIAKQYALLEDYETAVKYFLWALKQNDLEKYMKVSLLNSLAESYYYLKNYKKLRKIIEQSIKLYDHQAAAYYLLYSLEKSLAHWELAESALNILEKNTEWIRKNNSPLSNEILLKTSFFQQEKAELIPFVINSYLKLSRNVDALNLIEKIIDEHSDKSLYDIYAKLLINQQRYKDAVKAYQDIIRKFSPDIKDIKSLAGLYAKTGERDKAVALLQSLQS